MKWLLRKGIIKGEEEEREENEKILAGGREKEIKVRVGTEYIYTQMN